MTGSDEKKKRGPLALAELGRKARERAKAGKAPGLNRAVRELPLRTPCPCSIRKDRRGVFREQSGPDEAHDGVE